MALQRLRLKKLNKPHPCFSDQSRLQLLNSIDTYQAINAM